MTQSFTVTGMSCGGCTRSVERVVGKLEGVQGVAVDLDSGRVDVEGAVAPDAVVAAITKAGFEARPQSP